MPLDGAGNPPQGPGGHLKSPIKSPSLWERVKSWDSQFSVAKGLAIVTLLTSFFGGYFQYLNAYQSPSGDFRPDCRVF